MSDENTREAVEVGASDVTLEEILAGDFVFSSVEAYSLWVDEDDSVWAVEVLRDGVCITRCVTDPWKPEIDAKSMTQHVRDY